MIETQDQYTAAAPAGRKPPRRTRGKPNNVDAHVGARVRLRRSLLGISQQTLAESIGLTFQQVQKYERGGNRIGAGRLFELAKVLDVPVGYFFEELDAGPGAKPPEQFTRAELTLNRELNALPPHQRLAVVRLVRTLAEGPIAAPAEAGAHG